MIKSIWVKAGTAYGPEIGGPQGCEVMLIAAGTFPLPTFPADERTPESEHEVPIT